MKEKPPTLSDEERLKRILRMEETVDAKPPYSCLPPDSEEWLNLKVVAILYLFKQAKAEVAREIFGEIEQHYMGGGEHPRMDGIIIKTPKIINIHEIEWQSLKGHYLNSV